MFWLNAFIDVLLTFYVTVCLFMILVVLMQRSKQDGLGAAFGGGFTDSVWGAQTSQVLVKTTVVLAALFFILSISLARLYSYRATVAEKPSTLQQELLQPVAPVPTTQNTAPDNTPAVPTANVPTPVAPVTSTSSVPVPASTNTSVPAAPTPAK
jgi:preprotein translocase subunit SecG